MFNLFKKSDEKEYVCKYCNGVFPDLEHLKKHTKRAHAKGK